MKWKNKTIMILQNGLLWNRSEMCRAINTNAMTLEEACQHIKFLEEKIEILAEQLKEQK